MGSTRKRLLLSEWFTRHPDASGFIVFCLLISISTYVTVLSYQIDLETAQRDEHNILRAVEKNIDQTLTYSKLAALALSMSVRENSEPAQFDSLAEHVVKTYNCVDAVQLVPKGIIKYVYPFEENKGVIGYNILQDSTRNKEAFKAIAQKKMFFAGPFELRQGGMGIVGRLPVFFDNRFWGFSAVIIRMNTLLKNAGIENGELSGYQFQLSKINPLTRQEEYFFPSTKHQERGDGISVFLPEGEWKLHVYPSKLDSDYSILALGGFGLLFSLISSLFVVRLLRTPAKLHELVESQSAELLKSHQRNNAILQALPDMLFILDDKGKFIYHHNPQKMDTIQPPEVFLGKNVAEIMPPDLAKVVLEYVHQVILTGKFMMHNYELQDESGLRYFEARYAQSSQTEVLAVIREITRQKKSELEVLQINRELRELSDHLQTVREDERAALSRELHDELGQQLTALALDLHWMKKVSAGTENNMLDKIEDAISLVHQSTATVRRINTALRPSILDDLGLISAIEWQLNDFSDRHGIKSRLVCDCHKLDISASKSITVFRIVQEALNNVAKHAKANLVLVKGYEDRDNLKIVIEDDGIGFEKDKSRKNISFGLLGMKERAKSHGGYVHVNSMKGKGTRIEVCLPIDGKSSTA